MAVSLSWLSIALLFSLQTLFTLRSVCLSTVVPLLVLVVVSIVLLRSSSLLLSLLAWSCSCRLLHLLLGGALHELTLRLAHESSWVHRHHARLHGLAILTREALHGLHTTHLLAIPRLHAEGAHWISSGCPTVHLRIESVLGSISSHLLHIGHLLL